MALSEQEEFELLSLERERAVGPQGAPAAAPPAAAEPESPDYGKKLAPYYLGPFGTARLGGEILRGIDKAVEKGAYKMGEKATDIATGMGASPEVAAGAGYLANVGTQAGVAFGLPALASKGASMLTKGSKTLMQSAIKPNQAARMSGKADQAIDTMLQRGYSATEAGAEKLQSRISTLENEIQGILNTSPKTANTKQIADTLKDALDKVKYNLSAVDDVETIRKAYKEFVNHPIFQGQANIPLNVLNKMKQAVYKNLGDSAYMTTRTSTGVLADKTLARGIREAVAKAEPGVVPTLKEQSELVNALKVLKPRVTLEGNKNLIGMGVLSPRLQQTLLWLVERSPAVKSSLARAGYTVAPAVQAAGQVAPAAIATGAAIRD